MSNKIRDSLSDLPGKGKRYSTSKLRSSCDACASSKIRCGKERPVWARCVATNGSCVYGISQKFGRAPRTQSCHDLSSSTDRVLAPDNPASVSNSLMCHVQQHQQMPDTDCHSAAGIPFSNRAGAVIPPPTSLSPLSINSVQDTVLASIPQCFQGVEHTREQSCSMLKGSAQYPVDSWDISLDLPDVYDCPNLVVASYLTLAVAYPFCRIRALSEINHQQRHASMGVQYSDNIATPSLVPP